MKLVAAGNVEIPAYLSLKTLGYNVSVNSDLVGEQVWLAKKNGTELNGASPLELLALVKLMECRGTSWQATDQEIEDFLATYGSK